MSDPDPHIRALIVEDPNAATFAKLVVQIEIPEAPHMTNWRTTPPSSEAAEYIRRWIDSRIAEIESGRAMFASELLGTAWYMSIDTSRMPWTTFDHLTILFADARKALRDKPSRAEDAIADLRRARELVTPAG